MNYKTFVFWLGICIVILTIGAYIIHLFGKPVHLFWAPFGIAGFVMVVVGWKKNKEE